MNWLELWRALLQKALYPAATPEPSPQLVGDHDPALDVACRFIAEWEGCRLLAYADIVGKMTIGYGRTTNVHAGDVITQEQADNWLREEVGTFLKGVRAVIQKPMTINQAAAFCSLSYNVGLTAFRGSTAARKFDEGDIAGAAAGILLFNKAGNRVVQGLVNRRAAERALFLKESL